METNHQTVQTYLMDVTEEQEEFISTKNGYLHASFLKISLVCRSWSLARYISELVAKLGVGSSQCSGKRRHLLKSPLRIIGWVIWKKPSLLL